MKLKIFLPIGLLLFAFACSSDDSNSGDDGGQNQNGILIKQINYNSADEDGTFVETFDYDGNKLISIVDSEVGFDDDYKSTFIYTNDKLVRVNNFEEEELMEYVTLEYNVEGLLLNFTTFIFDIDGENTAIKNIISYENGNSNFSLERFRGDFTSQTEPSGTTNYIVQNGNISNVSYDGSNDTLSFLYDSKNSIYKNITDIELIALIFDNTEYGFDIYGINNNVTQLTDDQGVFVSVERTEYTYNTNDYPSTAMYYYDDELDSNIEFIYE